MIYILRHARTKGEDRILGRVDEPILEDQYRLIKEKAIELRDKNIEMIISSPLKRCIQTAEIIGKEFGLDILTNNDLIERDFGLLNGLTWDEFCMKYPLEIKNNKKNYQPDLKDAETIEEVEQRVRRFIKGMTLDKNILLVTHAGVIRIILREFGGISIERSREIDIGNLGMFEL